GVSVRRSLSEELAREKRALDRGNWTSGFLGLSLGTRDISGCLSTIDTQSRVASRSSCQVANIGRCLPWRRMSTQRTYGSVGRSISSQVDKSRGIRLTRRMMTTIEGVFG